MMYRNVLPDTITVETAIAPVRVPAGAEIAISPAVAQQYLDAGVLAPVVVEAAIVPVADVPAAAEPESPKSRTRRTAKETEE